MKIGIFDSGLGGLSVLHRAKKMMPDAHFIYYADEKHVPYGEKEPEQLRVFLREIFQFMMEKQVDGIVIACNTATTVVTKEYREQFPIPIVGMEPAVKRAVDLYGSEEKRILVAATPITIGGKKLHDLVNQVDVNQNVDLVATPGLVHFAESGQFESQEVENYLRQELSDQNLDSYGTVVLGCTHFNYFKKNFLSIFPQGVHFVDGNEGTIRQLQRVLPEESDKEELAGEVEFYFSGEAVTEREMERVQVCMDQLDLVYGIN